MMGSADLASRVGSCLLLGGILAASAAGAQAPALPTVDHPLAAAIREGNAATVDHLLEAGADPNALLPAGANRLQRPLDFAARTGQLEIAKLLLQAGADPEGPGYLDQPPLYWAAHERFPAIAELLVAHGAKLPFCRESRATEELVSAGYWERLWRLAYEPPYRVKEYDCTVLLQATLPLEDPELIRELGALGADLDSVGLIGETKSKSTPLWYALARRRLDLVRLLAELGADPNAPTGDIYSHLGRTLTTCRGDYCLEAVETLLEIGANPNFVMATGCSDLLAACQGTDRPDVIAAMVRSGANFESVLPDCSHKSCLHALLNNRSPIETFRHLFVAGVDPSGEPGGLRPLVVAAEAQRLDVVKLLLDLGADVEVQDGDGISPLMAAAAACDLEAVDLFLALGARPSTIDNQGRTVLHHAVSNRLPRPRGSAPEIERLLRILLRTGVPVNAPDRSGSTPLLLAARNGSYDAIPILLQAGADPNTRNFEHRGPVHALAEGGSTRTLSTLLDAGALPDSRDRDGTTPMMAAAASKRLRAVEILREAGASSTPIDRFGETAPEKYWKAMLELRPREVDAPGLGVKFSVPEVSTRLDPLDWAQKGGHAYYIEDYATGTLFGVVVAHLERRADLWLPVVTAVGVARPKFVYPQPPVNLELSEVSGRGVGTGANLVRAELLKEYQVYVAYASELQSSVGGSVLVAVAGGPSSFEPEVRALLANVLESLEPNQSTVDRSSEEVGTPPSTPTVGRFLLGLAALLLLLGAGRLLYALKQRRKPRIYVPEELRRPPGR